MISATIERELHQQMENLPSAQQRQVLDFARFLAGTRPRGVKGSALLAFAGAIPAEDLNAMQAAIEADCGQVEADGW